MVTIDLGKVDPEHIREDMRLIRELQSAGVSDDIIQAAYDETIKRREEGEGLTNLERRALLGDRQAQEECTEKGIALPCPKCGKSVQRFETVAGLCCLDSCSEAYYDLRNYFGVVCNTLKGGCGIFVCGEEEASVKSALAEWNTRSAPPIGHCKDCANRHSSEFCECRPDDAFCSDFEPREG